MNKVWVLYGYYLPIFSEGVHSVFDVYGVYNNEDTALLKCQEVMQGAKDYGFTFLSKKTGRDYYEFDLLEELGTFQTYISVIGYELKHKIARTIALNDRKVELKNKQNDVFVVSKLALSQSLTVGSQVYQIEGVFDNFNGAYLYVRDLVDIFESAKYVEVQGRQACIEKSDFYYETTVKAEYSKGFKFVIQRVKIV